MSFGAGDDFTVRGRLGERSVTVTYRQGRLDGDDQVIRAVTDLLGERASFHLTPQDDGHPASIDDPYAVMAAIQEVVSIDEVDGDYPIPEADDSAT